MEKFYVTLIRGRRTARLLGPFGTREEAEGLVDKARILAGEVDPFTGFDAFGVSKWRLPEGATEWPQGRLNGMLRDLDLEAGAGT